MIGYIKGKVQLIGNDFIIIENYGIGYKINVNENTISQINTQLENTQIFTFMNVKEDEISLFGFLTLEELNLFKKLITVSGVGPKGALSLLNTMNTNELIVAIISSDIQKLSTGQGIGKKIAQRIAMELKDKVEPVISFDNKKEVSLNQENPVLNDAIEGLVSLGFTKSEVILNINKEKVDNLTSSQIISLMLKKLSK